MDQLLLAAVKSGSNDEAQQIANKCQQQPQILDPVLAECVDILTSSSLSNDLQLGLVYTLCKVRGWKVIANLLPSDAMLLEPLLVRIESATSWQSRYVILIWLAVVILSPFHIDSWGSESYQQVFEVATSWIACSGKERDAAALLLSRLITRDRDSCTQRLQELVEWAAQGPSSPSSSLKKIGLFQVCANMSSSLDLGPYLEAFGVLKNSGGNDTLSTKLRIKILGRTALRGFDPERLEFTVAECIAELENQAITVRASAAKYVARLAQHLVKSGNAKLAADIFQAILDLFEIDLIPDSGNKLALVSPERWQGALMAIAEFIRRGLSINIPSVLKILPGALHFEQRRLSVSVGTSVRDSACYVCWALFRNVPNLTSTQRYILYEALTGLIFDRQINARRAASAALQEGMGRYSAGPAEVRFVELFNYRSVGSVSKCYIDIAPRVSAKSRYLVMHGVCSFDPEMRRLAAEAIPQFASDVDIGELEKLSASSDLDFRHGASLALAALGRTATIGKPNFGSDLWCEAALLQLQLQTDPDPELVALCMRSENPHVESAARKFASSFKTDDRYIKIWKARMTESSTFVAALATCGKGLLEASRLPNAISRSYALMALRPSTPEKWHIFIAALDDYQSTKSGDVGSIVRFAATKRVLELWDSAGTDWKSDVSVRLWRLATERSEKLRCAASNALNILNMANLPDDTDSETYFDAAIEQVPQEYFRGVLMGLVSTSGALQSRREPVNAALNAIASHDGLPEAILDLDRSKNQSVIPCLARLVELGVEPKPQTKLLAVAFNTTVQSRVTSVVMHAVAILGWLAQTHSKAAGRLKRLVAQHPEPQIRVRAAEALVEAGITSDLLETTEWHRPSKPTLEQLLESF